MNREGRYTQAEAIKLSGLKMMQMYTVRDRCRISGVIELDAPKNKKDGTGHPYSERDIHIFKRFVELTRRPSMGQALAMIAAELDEPGTEVQKWDVSALRPRDSAAEFFQ